jgi:hypothetical protein
MADGKAHGNSRYRSGNSEAHDVYQQQDYADKMLVSLLKIELLSTADSFDSGEFYHGRLIVTSSSSN